MFAQGLKSSIHGLCPGKMVSPHSGDRNTEKVERNRKQRLSASSTIKIIVQ